MAKLNGILKIEGTLQDMTFYKIQDGHLVKTKSSAQVGSRQMKRLCAPVKTELNLAQQRRQEFAGFGS